MRKDKRTALTRLVWRDRLRGVRPWYLIVAAAVLGFIAYGFDPPIPMLFERGTVLHERQKQGMYSESFPYLVIQRPNRSVVTVRSDARGLHHPGQDVCVLISRGLLFGRQSASLSDQGECRP